MMPQLAHSSFWKSCMDCMQTKIMDIAIRKGITNPWAMVHYWAMTCSELGHAGSWVMHMHAAQLA